MQITFTSLAHIITRTWSHTHTHTHTLRGGWNAQVHVCVHCRVWAYLKIFPHMHGQDQLYACMHLCPFCIIVDMDTYHKGAIECWLIQLHVNKDMNMGKLSWMCESQFVPSTMCWLGIQLTFKTLTTWQDLHNNMMVQICNRDFNSNSRFPDLLHIMISYMWYYCSGLTWISSPGQLCT